MTSIYEFVKIQVVVLALCELDLGLGPYHIGNYKNTLEEQM